MQVCKKCGGILFVRLKGSRREQRRNWGDAGASFWDYEYFMPNGKYRHFKIGGTKLIDGYSKDLFLKVETENPTRSFKDRGSVIEVQKAKEYGYKEIACASTGNMAYSISHYAHSLKMQTKVFISKNASADKVEDIISTKSASLVRVDGDFNKAFKLAEEYARKTNSFIAGDYCYRMEGQKTIGYEIMKQHPDVDNIIIPVGNATLFSGVFKGLVNLKEIGELGKMPRLICVQAERCNPIGKAFKSGKKLAYQNPETEADAIAVGFPLFGYNALEALKKTHGTTVSVSDSEMRREQKTLEKEVGIIAELAGAASVAACKKLKPKGKTVAIVSGGNV